MRKDLASRQGRGALRKYSPPASPSAQGPPWKADMGKGVNPEWKCIRNQKLE